MSKRKLTVMKPSIGQSIKGVVCTKVNKTLFWLVDRCITKEHREGLLGYLELSKENIPKAEFADKVMESKEAIERTVERIKEEHELMSDINLSLIGERDRFENGLKRIAYGYLNGDIEAIKYVLIEFGYLRIISEKNFSDKEEL